MGSDGMRPHAMSFLILPPSLPSSFLLLAPHSLASPSSPAKSDKCAHGLLENTRGLDQLCKFAARGIGRITESHLVLLCPGESRPAPEKGGMHLSVGAGDR